MQKALLCITVLAQLLTISPADAQQKQKLNIDEATVFLRGAQLSSSAKVKFPKGESEVVFTNVAGDINTQSMTVNAGPGVVVESAVFQNDFLADDKLSPAAEHLKDTIETVTEKRGTIANKITVLNEQVAVLQNNRKVGGDNSGLSVTELTKMLDLIGNRMENLLAAKSQQDVLLKKMDELLAKLRKQLEEEKKKDFQPGGQIIVKFLARDARTNDITISYTVTNAGWTPIYDIRVDAINMPATLYYKANVFQNSGVAWNKVKLTLSSGNPQEGAQAPTLTPWYLSFYTPAYANRVNTVARFNKALVADQYEGAAAAGSLKEESSDIGAYVTVNNTGVNTRFDIDLPYTIPNDGKQHLVAIRQQELSASYRYYAVPRLDKDAFLQAQVTDWANLDLLPGQTNIFYEGTYVGQGYIDPRNISDTLTFSLGRDKKVVVCRERDKKLRSVRTIGSNVCESFAYKINVRNTRKDAIYIVIQDQLPVSNDKDIVIEDKETGDARYDEATGMLKWEVGLQPGKGLDLTFGYTVKYPKGKQVNMLR